MLRKGGLVWGRLCQLYYPMSCIILKYNAKGTLINSQFTSEGKICYFPSFITHQKAKFATFLHSLHLTNSQQYLPDER